MMDEPLSARGPAADRLTKAATDDLTSVPAGAAKAGT